MINELRMSFTICVPAFNYRICLVIPNLNASFPNRTGTGDEDTQNAISSKWPIYLEN